MAEKRIEQGGEPARHAPAWSLTLPYWAAAAPPRSRPRPPGMLQRLRASLSGHTRRLPDSDE